jgi:hypothetical protein
MPHLRLIGRDESVETRDERRAPAASEMAFDRVGRIGLPMRHEAERAVEDVQRRLDNLKALLGDSFASDDSPRAA